MFRALAAAVALTLAVAGCGGVSKEDYASDLDAICADLEEETRRISEAQPQNPAELAAQLDDLRRTVRSGIARMKELERPDGEDGERAERFVTRLESAFEQELLPALEELERAVRAEDRRRIRAASERLQAIDEEETQRLAAELGADRCAENRSD